MFSFAQKRKTRKEEKRAFGTREEKRCRPSKKPKKKGRRMKGRQIDVKIEDAVECNKKRDRDREREK